ncbi:KGG domain-containing protein, partial [Acinetobacter lwoffii]|uniref:KGG domain-containing protein n=1 Tax=Acinetobacter lwoffii TaxID=28090 RepID=UPI001FF66259
MANQNDDTNTSNRGFASMDPDRQREIASQGGKAAHESGNAHEFTSEEAREAGRAAHRSGNAHEFTSEEAREAGSRSHINDNNSGGRGRGRSRD